MHFLFLRIENACLLLIHTLGKVFDIEKLLHKGVKNNIEQLAESGIHFTPKEILKDDKTIGWIINYFLRITRVISYLFKDIDNMLISTLQISNTTESYYSEMSK